MKSVLITGATINTGVAIVEKFASKGKNVVFTGRDPEKVAEAEKKYRKKFPNVKIIGCAIDSLLDERTVDEDGVAEMFDFKLSASTPEFGIYSSPSGISGVNCQPQVITFA